MESLRQRVKTTTLLLILRQYNIIIEHLVCLKPVNYVIINAIKVIKSLDFIRYAFTNGAKQADWRLALML